MSDTNRAVQQQMISRGLKFRILEVKGLYYLCSENKGADQLRSYCAADLHLCFCIFKKQVFSQRGSYGGLNANLKENSVDQDQTAPLETV